MSIKFIKGELDYNFYEMGINHSLASSIYELAECHLFREAKYSSMNKKWHSVQNEVHDKVRSFLESMFKEYVYLNQALSTLKLASNNGEICLPDLKALYKKYVTELSSFVNDRLLLIREQVETTCCYNDGIPLLTAFETATKHGLAEHLNHLPFDCSQLLQKWILERSNIFRYQRNVMNSVGTMVV
jgi:hypothetical protein